MATHKLLLDDDFEYDFLLLAIHTSLEAYQIAFALNKSLGLQLARRSEDLNLIKEKHQANFSLFEYENKRDYVTYHLFSNKTKTLLENVAQGLFSDEREILVRDLFINDLPKVDFFLKVYDEANAFAKAKILKQINEIPQIVTAYSVDTDELKTKQNLIFE